MSSLPWLDEFNPIFPSTNNALEDPAGLLAAGGNLGAKTLITAYSKGIFPWFDDSQPILWWTPSPRMVMAPGDIHVARSLRKLYSRQVSTIRADHSFSKVLEACANAPRRGQQGTWITDDMMAAYCHLHELGYAHSVETWQNGTLVGGLYGVAIGKVFFGESMFSSVSGSSKIAFVSLCKQLSLWGYNLIDCQVHTPLLESLGAKEVSRSYFESILHVNVVKPSVDNWKTGEFRFDGPQ